MVKILLKMFINYLSTIDDDHHSHVLGLRNLPISHLPLSSVEQQDVYDFPHIENMQDHPIQH